MLQPYQDWTLELWPVDNVDQGEGAVGDAFDLKAADVPAEYGRRLAAFKDWARRFAADKKKHDEEFLKKHTEN